MNAYDSLEPYFYPDEMEIYKLIDYERWKLIKGNGFIKNLRIRFTHNNAMNLDRADRYLIFKADFSKGLYATARVPIQYIKSISVPVFMQDFEKYLENMYIDSFMLLTINSMNGLYKTDYIPRIDYKNLFEVFLKNRVEVLSFYMRINPTSIEVFLKFDVSLNLPYRFKYKFTLDSEELNSKKPPYLIMNRFKDGYMKILEAYE